MCTLHVAFRIILYMYSTKIFVTVISYWKQGWSYDKWLSYSLVCIMSSDYEICCAFQIPQTLHLHTTTIDNNWPSYEAAKLNTGWHDPSSSQYLHTCYIKTNTRITWRSHELVSNLAVPGIGTVRIILQNTEIMLSSEVKFPWLRNVFDHLNSDFPYNRTLNN